MEENNPIGPVEITNPTPNPISPPLTPSEPNSAPTPIPQMMDPQPKSFKKYIIIGLIIILIGAITVFAYKFLNKDPQIDETTQPLTNSLTDSQTTEPEITPEMKELEGIVEDLKDNYPEEAPPSLNITIPTDNSSQTTTKIAR